jgi:hypothetical protein
MGLRNFRSLRLTTLLLAYTNCRVMMCIHNPPIALNDTMVERRHALLAIGALESPIASSLFLSDVLWQRARPLPVLSQAAKIPAITHTSRTPCCQGESMCAWTS